MTACFNPIFGEAKVLPPLDEEEEKRLLGVFTTKGDAQAKSSLIEHNLRLVIYIAGGFHNTGVCMEELVSVGTIGLIKGVNSFKPEKNTKLVTYVARCIKNEILMYLRRCRKTAREIPVEEVSVLENAVEDTALCSLEAQAEVQMLQIAISRLSLQEQKILQLRYGINSGDGKEKTQQEVSDLLGLSQSYISRLEKRIIRQLRMEFDLLDS